MTGTELQNQAAAELPLSVTEMKQQIQLIQQVLESVMLRDIHYGVIPGTNNKPSLLKPGAEKIMATFRLAADPQVLDLSTDDVVRYRVTVRLISASGRFVGAGLGECSSNEEKYKWRAAPDSEYDETPSDRRRAKWKKGWQGKPDYLVKQVRMEPADVANTVLKMAKKRAQVDAVLTATAASDIFAQDLEDLPEGMAPETTAGPAGVRAQNSTHRDADSQKVIDQLEAVAKKGMPALLEAWGKLTTEQRTSVGSAFGAIKALAENAGGQNA